jgi:hypothetical protein
MTILCIKMKTGEDVIARVDAPTTFGAESSTAKMLDETPPRMCDGDVTIDEPRVITLQEVPGGRMALALVPYLMGDHETKMIVNLKDAAVGIYKARKEIEDSYLAQTSKIDLSATLGKKLS